MKINGYWLALGILCSIDHFYNASLEYSWITIFNVICVFIGFGLAFKEKKNNLKVVKE